MSFKLKSPLTAIVSITVLVITGAALVGLPRARHTPVLGLDLTGFQLTHTKSGRHDGLTFETVRYDQGANRVTLQTVSNIDEAVANQRIDHEIGLTLHAYDSFTAPYPGVISRTVECPKEFYPQVKTRALNHGSLRHLNTFATTRYTVGVCTKGDAALTASFIYLFCSRSKTLTIISAFNTQVLEQFTMPNLQCSF